MFGGATQYVETVETILAYIESHNPTTDELVGWHRGTFENVSSRESILRRVQYLEQVGFIAGQQNHWKVGSTGQAYLDSGDIDTFIRIMCERNVGLRSLLYELTSGPMTIEEVSDQQLDTHAELGWSRGEIDMAQQRVNWLRSMGLVEKHGDLFQLTTEGRQFLQWAVDSPIEIQWNQPDAQHQHSAWEYDTSVTSRVMDPEFRQTVLARYGSTCPISRVDHPHLLDVAHILPWHAYPEHRPDLQNVLPLSKTHHAAFDRHLFTIDQAYCLRVNPTFDTNSGHLQRTILQLDGKELPLGERVNPDYLAQHNQELSWV